MPSEPQSFRIHVPDDELRSLQDRLALTRFPDELEGANWDYGMPLINVKKLVDYWQNGYDWRKQEAAINELFPQYTMDVEVEGHGSLNIHFVHQKSESENSVPLLFVHGWPGNFLEVAKLVPLLTKPPAEQPSFHVVAFSLPGFAFSEAPKKPGFAPPQIAEVGHKLMLALGYKKYAVQGGDWGSLIANEIAIRYGEAHCEAIHINLILSQPPKLFKQPVSWFKDALSPLSPEERGGLQRTSWFVGSGLGYFRMQATQPQTLAYSLADSPVGLMAWIAEKMRNWTDDYPWTDDEILTWVSLYWHSRAGPGASIRIYYEWAHSEGWESNPMGKGLLYKPTHNNVRIGLARFPKDVVVNPLRWAKSVGNVVSQSTHTKGGHFASVESPEAIVEDLRRMFANRPAFA